MIPSLPTVYGALLRMEESPSSGNANNFGKHETVDYAAKSLSLLRALPSPSNYVCALPRAKALANLYPE